MWKGENHWGVLYLDKELQTPKACKSGKGELSVPGKRQFSDYIMRSAQAWNHIPTQTTQMDPKSCVCVYVRIYIYI